MNQFPERHRLPKLLQREIDKFNRPYLSKKLNQQLIIFQTISPWNAGGPVSIPGLGRAPGGGRGNQLQDSWPENSTDMGAAVVAWRLQFMRSQSRTRLNSYTRFQSRSPRPGGVLTHSAATAKSLQSCPTLCDPKDVTEAESPMIWPPDGKNWLTGKDPDVGRDWE